MHTAQTSTQRATLAGILLCVTLAALPDAWSQAVAADSAKPATAASAPAPAGIQLGDSIVAVVNTEVITRHELAERMHVVEAQLKSQGSASPPLAELQKQVLENMIVERAQLQLAKEKGIIEDDIMLDRAMSRIAEQNKMTLQQLRNQIEREGTNYSVFREEIRDSIILQRVREAAVDNKIQISDAEVDNYLAAQNGQTQGQWEFNLAQILVRIPENASADQITERRRRAQEVLEQLKAGGDFAKLAATYSDSSDALKGGDVGWRSLDRLPQMFADAIVNLKPGQVTELMKSANGYHILKLVGKRAPSLVKVGAGAAPAVLQTHVRHILIKVNQVVSMADARRRLIELKERLDNNAATFEELAKLYSNDLSASKGGDLGWVYPGDTVADFEHAMDALQPGQVSDPVETPFGMHLIQVVERKSEDVSKERQRLAARQALRERKMDEATQDWIRQIRDRAYVEYRLDDK